MQNTQPAEYALGIDLGSNSLGWAIIHLVDGEPAELFRAGARVFEAGMEGDLISGREESRNLKRRQMRLQRRQTWRRSRRLKKIFNLLQRYELLPAGCPRSPQERQDFLNRLDLQILSSPWFAAKASSCLYPEPAQTMPYILRAAALDEALEPSFLGRALYHLAQRRGFLSNRKQEPKKDEDEGAVKEGIADLRKAIQESSARTLGEFLSRCAPAQERIRSRWTARDMYEAEFEEIWTAQAKYHPSLHTAERKKELHRAIFHQRRLWFDANTIGVCELEARHRRAPAYLLTSQRFRLLQTVNNLKLLPPGGVETPLSPEDRKKLIDALELKGHMKFAQIRKLLGLGKEYQFNLERGGEKSIKGNRTNAEFSDAFGERWLAMSPAEREQAVEYVHSFQKAGKLEEATRKRFQLDNEGARKLAHIALEPDYMNLSRRAMEKLLPLLEEGKTYSEARKKVYPESFEPSEPVPLLPPVDRALAEIRNPAVMRSLTELRKVVNAVIRQYGKPTCIRIELARDLKKSKKQRVSISEVNRNNEAARSKAAEEIKAGPWTKDPKPDDIRKYLLAQECHWQCPYTGNTISMQGLLGPEPQFDIEHIVPFAVSMDSSFHNLTLCYVPENRTIKGKQTPWQAYSGDAARYEAILERVRKFGGERQMVAAKLRRFLMNDDELEVFLADFRNRQLNDTAYATKLAARYLGLLYGGVNDADGKKRIQASSGQATGYFRSLWALNSILNDGPTVNGGRVAKTRADHRHHAIDAVVIGVTDAGMIKRLADAAQRAPLEHRRRFASLSGPWPNFTESIRAEIDKVVVSHRVSRKVSGSLHKDTNYSLREFGENVRRHRVRLADLSEADVASDAVIADAGVREVVRAKLAVLGGGEPKKLFALPENLPCFVASDGRMIPIRRVRIQETIKTRKVGDGYRQRFVKPGGNHHLEFFGLPGPGGDKKWETLGVVTMLDACERLKKREPVVQKFSEPGWEFRFSLCQGDTLVFGDGPYKGAYFVVRAISEEEKTGSVKVEIVPMNDARQQKQIKQSKQWITKSPNELRRWSARKIAVSPLGEMTEAHD